MINYMTQYVTLGSFVECPNLALLDGLIVLNPIASAHPFGPVKMQLKAKNSNDLIWLSVFFWSANALCVKLVGATSTYG